MSLPAGVTLVTNIKGDDGEKGDTGTFVSALAVGVPAGSPPAVRMVGPEDAKGVEFDIPAGLPGVNAVPAAEAVGDYLSAPGSPARAGFDSGVADLLAGGTAASAALQSVLDTWSVRHVSAVMVRDGVGFEAALRNILAETGDAPRIIYLPAGEYHVTTYFDLPSNVTIIGQGDGTMIHKNGNAVVFRAYQKQSIHLVDVAFRGKIDTTGATITPLWAINCDGVYVDRLTARYAVGEGHVIDLQGCHTVRVRDCRFYGKTASAKHYAEAIQIDNSVAIGASGDTTGITFDGRACDDVIVERCSAEPIGAYRAPKLVGSHTGVQNRPHGHVTVRECVQHDTPLPVSGGSWLTGWSFVNTRLVRAKGNWFVYSAVGAVKPNVLMQMHNFSSVIPLADANNPDAVASEFPGQMVGVLDSTENDCDVDLISPVFFGYHVPTVHPSFVGKYANTDGVLPRVYVRGGMVFLSWRFNVPLAQVVWAEANMRSTVHPVLQLPQSFAPPVTVPLLMLGPKGVLCEGHVGTDGVVSVGNYKGSAYPTDGNLYFVAVMSWPTAY